MFSLILSLFILFLEPLVFLVGWNNLVHPTFGLVELNYLQSFGLYMLFTLPTLSKTNFFLNTEKGLSLFINLFIRDDKRLLDTTSKIREADLSYMKYKIPALLLGLAFFQFAFN